MKPPDKKWPHANVAGREPQRPTPHAQHLKPAVAQSKNAVAQTKVTLPAQASRHRVAPPVYKPQAKPPVAQRKAVAPMPQASHISPHAHGAQAAPKVLQTKRAVAAPQPAIHNWPGARPQGLFSSPTIQRAAAGAGAAAAAIAAAPPVAAAPPIDYVGVAAMFAAAERDAKKVDDKKAAIDKAAFYAKSAAAAYAHVQANDAAAIRRLGCSVELHRAYHTAYGPGGEYMFKVGKAAPAQSVVHVHWDIQGDGSGRVTVGSFKAFGDRTRGGTGHRVTDLTKLEALGIPMNETAYKIADKWER